jgi:hypothetical protein
MLLDLCKGLKFVIFPLQFSTVSTPTTPSCGSLQKSNMVLEVAWTKLLGQAFDM